MVVTVGSDIDIVDIVKKKAIDMAQCGLLVEVKHLQVTHSKKGLLFAMLPKNTDISYMQQHVQQCLIGAVHKTIDQGNDLPMTKDFAEIDGDFKVLVNLAYPPSNLKHQKKGTKTIYNAQNKQMFGLEYNKEFERIIFVVTKNFKALIRKIKIPKDDAYNGSMRKHK